MRITTIYRASITVPDALTISSFRKFLFFLHAAEEANELETEFKSRLMLSQF